MIPVYRAHLIRVGLPVVLLAAWIALTACVGTHHALQDDSGFSQRSLESWLDNTLIPYLIQQFDRHPRFRSEQVLLVRMQGENVSPHIDELTEQIRQKITDAMLTRPGIELAWRPSSQTWQHHQSLDEINTQLEDLGKKLKIDVDAFQSNHEGVLIEKIQQAFDAYDGMLINPAALTHTSIAIRDALAMLSFPIIEIHISNISKREPFRHNSLIADVVTGRISGFGINGYNLALRGLAQIM